MSGALVIAELVGDMLAHSARGASIPRDSKAAMVGALRIAAYVRRVGR